jgi:integrase/recombinase XerD
MTPLRQQMTTALELNGKSPATIEAYVREVYLVSKFYAKRPDMISEEALERYRLHRKNVDHLAPTSIRTCYSGIRFFYQRVLGRKWRIFAFLHARRGRRRPSVLSRPEVYRLLQAVATRRVSHGVSSRTSAPSGGTLPGRPARRVGCKLRAQSRPDFDRGSSI